MLFVDFSSAFNTINSSKLVNKLLLLGLDSHLCKWIKNFLTDRPQHVRLGNITSSTTILNTGTPQGCVLSPLLYSLFTYDCFHIYDSNSIFKFADDTAVVGLVTNNKETAYREEVQSLVSWCSRNNLILNTKKAKEIIIDFRKCKTNKHDSLEIHGEEVEQVQSFRYLALHLAEDLTWGVNTKEIGKKAQQRLFFL